MRLKLQRLMKNKFGLRVRLSELMEEAIRNHNSVTVWSKYYGLEDEATAEQWWSRHSDALVEAANEVAPKRLRSMRQDWTTEEILRKMERRQQGARNRHACFVYR